MSYFVKFLILLTFVTGSWAVASLAPPVPNANCPLIDDVNHAVMLPDPTDCSKYFSCLKGMAYWQQCPNNLLWSTLTYRCDYPDKAKCALPTPADEINESPANALPPSFTNEILYQLHPNDCSKYYKCQALTCPNNYFWNSQTQKCDFPHKAQCPYVKNPTSLGSVPQHSLQMQPSRQDIFTFQYPNECAKFYECQIMSCAANYHWNVRLQQCDLPHNAQCSLAPEITEILETSTTDVVPTAFTAPPTIPVSTPITGNASAQCLDCVQICDGYLHHYLPHPADCHKFIQCNGWSFIHTCPDNLFWNAKLNTCDRICVAN